MIESCWCEMKDLWEERVGKMYVREMNELEGWRLGEFSLDMRVCMMWRVRKGMK